ncbi:TRAP transporter small permease [Thermovorax subterraneus]|nr:TRAP transporter small permease [Thermovorax subterraneus]
MKNITEKLATAIRLIATVLCILMTTVTFVQAMLRYLVGVSLVWAEELARYSMIWLCFLGAALAVSTDSHTRITFFVDLLPNPLRRYVYIFDDVVCLAFTCVITYYSINITKLTMMNISTGVPIPMGYVYGSLTLCGFLMVLYFLIKIYNSLTTATKEK